MSSWLGLESLESAFTFTPVYYALRQEWLSRDVLLKDRLHLFHDGEMNDCIEECLRLISLSQDDLLALSYLDSLLCNVDWSSVSSIKFIKRHLILHHQARLAIRNLLIGKFFSGLAVLKELFLLVYALSPNEFLLVAHNMLPRYISAGQLYRAKSSIIVICIALTDLLSCECAYLLNTLEPLFLKNLQAALEEIMETSTPLERMYILETHHALHALMGHDDLVVLKGTLRIHNEQHSLSEISLAIKDCLSRTLCDALMRMSRLILIISEFLSDSESALCRSIALYSSGTIYKLCEDPNKWLLLFVMCGRESVFYEILHASSMTYSLIKMQVPPAELAKQIRKVFEAQHSVSASTILFALGSCIVNLDDFETQLKNIGITMKDIVSMISFESILFLLEVYSEDTLVSLAKPFFHELKAILDRLLQNSLDQMISDCFPGITHFIASGPFSFGRGDSFSWTLKDLNCIFLVYTLLDHQRGKHLTEVFSILFYTHFDSLNSLAEKFN